MNIKTISIVAGLIAAFGTTTAVAADEYTRNNNLPATTVSTASTASRAAVHVAAVDEYQANQYSSTVRSDGLQRAQVVAEAIEARKLGLIAEGEGEVLTPTAAQASQIRLAGLNAINTQVAAK